MKKTPTVYILVGVPASGKTTWVAHQDWADQCAYISTDIYVEKYAESVGKTYSEVFEEYMPTAIDKMLADVWSARRLGKDIIWDQTSTTIASRKKKLDMLHGYQATAVVFKTPHVKELMLRLASRPGKTIPWNVVTNMIQGFEMPSKTEGFYDVVIV